MDIKAVVCDVDGTITDSRKNIQTKGIELLRGIERGGTPVILATGNVLPIAYGLATFIGLKGPLVAENGGIVHLGEDTWYLFSNEKALKAYEHLVLEMPATRRLLTDRWRVTEVALRREMDLDIVKEKLAGWPIEIEATGFAIHLMEPGHGKMAGIRKACDILGISVDDVVAFGDSDNDERMLRECGFGIAVGNASRKAREAADLVTDGDHSDGVEEGLRHLGLL